MSEKRFEDEGVEYNNNYNYALLDTHYEFDGKRIIEWNKHSDNAEYTDFERITEILNIKQMRLESLMKHREEVGKLFDRIDEQEATIITLKRRLEKINGGYGHLTHRNGLTANEWLIESQERELQKKNEQISDWIERHSKDIAKIGEQKSTISQLEEENEQLRLELETHKHPLWSTREAKRKVNKLADNLADEVKKNGLLNEELNQLRIENMRLKKRW